MVEEIEELVEESLEEQLRDKEKDKKDKNPMQKTREAEKKKD